MRSVQYEVFVFVRSGGGKWFLDSGMTDFEFAKERAQAVFDLYATPVRVVRCEFREKTGLFTDRTLVQLGAAQGFSRSTEKLTPYVKELLERDREMMMRAPGAYAQAGERSGWRKRLEDWIAG